MESQKRSVNRRASNRPGAKTLKKNTNGSTLTAPPKKVNKAPAARKSQPASILQRTVGTVAITQDEIALCAYFIGERRRNAGLPGDEHHDWLQAEEQLLRKKQSVKKSRKR